MKRGLLIAGVVALMAAWAQAQEAGEDVAIRTVWGQLRHEFAVVDGRYVVPSDDVAAFFHTLRAKAEATASQLEAEARAARSARADNPLEQSDLQQRRARAAEGARAARQIRAESRAAGAQRRPPRLEALPGVNLAYPQLLALGDVGTLDRNARVYQVMREGVVVHRHVYSSGLTSRTSPIHRVWVVGVDTTGLTDDREFRSSDVFIVSGTRSYGPDTIFELRPITREVEAFYRSLTLEEFGAMLTEAGFTPPSFAETYGDMRRRNPQGYPDEMREAIVKGLTARVTATER